METPQEHQHNLSLAQRRVADFIEMVAQRDALKISPIQLCLSNAGLEQPSAPQSSQE